MTRQHRILIAFATREGQTQRIAEHVAEHLRARGFASDVIDVAHPPTELDLARYSAAVIAASVHLGTHEKEMIAFVRSHATSLARVPTAFFSVSGTEATAEDPAKPFAQRAEAAEAVKQMLDRFLTVTGWTPTHAHPVAGAVRFSKYGVVVRFVLRRMLKNEARITDFTRDYEFTDWPTLDRFVDELARELDDGERLRATA